MTSPTSGSLCSCFAQLRCCGELKGFAPCRNGLVSRISTAPALTLTPVFLRQLKCKSRRAAGVREKEEALWGRRIHEHKQRICKSPHQLEQLVTWCVPLAVALSKLRQSISEREQAEHLQCCRPLRPVLKCKQSSLSRAGYVVAPSTSRALRQHGTFEARRLSLCWKDVSDSTVGWMEANSTKTRGENFNSGPDHETAAHCAAEHVRVSDPVLLLFCLGEVKRPYGIACFVLKKNATAVSEVVG